MKKKGLKKTLAYHDRDKVRKRLLLDPAYNNNPKMVELALYRTDFLFKNPLFVEEWINLKNYKESAESTPEDYKKKQQAFSKRWGFMFGPDVSYQRKKIVYGYGLEPEGTTTVKVDLRYPKTRILNEFKKVLNDYHDYYHEMLKDLRNTFEADDYISPGYKDEFFELVKNYEPDEIKGNIPSEANLNDYENYLTIWTMKEELSWSKVVTEWNKNNSYKIDIQTARNWHKAACKFIKEGIPGFRPFPQD